MTIFCMITVCLLVVAFVGAAIWLKKELPDSISALVYELPKKYQWVWSAWFAIVTILLFPPMVENFGGLGWITEMCLIGAALTPLVNLDTRKWHYILAIVGGVMTQVCVLTNDADILFTWAIFVFVMGSVFIQPDGWLGSAVNGKGVTVAEMTCFLSLMLGLIL